MKRILAIVILVSLIVTAAAPVLAVKTYRPATTEQKLAELSSQFSSLQANWGRFRLGGDFSLTPFANFHTSQNALPIIEFNQEVELFFDAFIDQNLQFSLKLANQRGWGTVYQSLGSLNINPFQIDEAFLKMQYPKTFNYLGRFRFSLGAFGIISDFFTYPVEGFAIQQAIGKYHLMAIYNRVTTLYNPADNQVESGADYLAGRAGWSNQSNIIGINIVPKGLGGERDFSLDWSMGAGDMKFAAELGWYSFDSNEYPDLNTGPVPGFIISYSYSPTRAHWNNTSYLQLKAGYFAPGFRPSYSSLAHVSGDDREWFAPNSQGIEVYLQNKWFNNYQIMNRLILLTPVETGAARLDYRLRSSIVKNITPVNQIQMGIDVKNFNNTFLGQVFAGWMLRF